MAKSSSRKIDWKNYNPHLVQRGWFTVWINKKVLENWLACKRRKRKRGRYIFYSNLAILVMTCISQYFSLPLRQSQGFFLSIFGLLNTGLPVPCYTTLCRRRKKLKIKITSYERGGPIDIVVDSTGVKMRGPGEWSTLVAKGGRRQWLKLHIMVSLATGEIKAWLITPNKVSDARAFPKLLSQIKGRIGEVIGDGAYDRKEVYEAIERLGGRAVIKPVKRAKLSEPSEKGPPLQRDENILAIRELGVEGWKKKRGYNRRSRVESIMSSFKRIFGGEVKARSKGGQRSEIGVRLLMLNIWTRLTTTSHPKIPFYKPACYSNI